jgi:uncharacterized protein YndB with AHSA1/START domain
MATATDAAPMARELTLTRLLDAPRALVFKAWTDPEHLMRWWGPHSFTTPQCEMDLRPGGALRIVMRGPDGSDYPMTGVFDEVQPPQRLSFNFTAEYPAGVAVLKGVTAITLTELDGKTQLVLTARATGLVPQAAQMLAGMEIGWSQTLERLQALVEAEAVAAAGPVFTLSRTFEAPRALVFKVFSEPEHLARWWGPKGWEWVKGEMDFRPGGQFHYCMALPDGQPMWGKFLYQAIDAPERIVFINGFSDAEGHFTRHPMAPTWPLQVLNVLTLEEQDGRTTLTLRGGPHRASAAEQQTFAAGFDSMRMGFGGTFDQLAAYLAEIQPPAS